MNIDTEIAEIQLVLPPELEEQRLHSLDQLQILDSPPEDRFERVTRMARLGRVSQIGGDIATF